MSQSTLSLASYAFLFCRCCCPCPLYVIYITQIHILYIAFIKCFTASLWMFFLYSTVTASSWTNTFVFISQLHTSINDIIVEESSRSPQTLQPIILWFPLSLYILVLWCSSGCGNYSFIQASSSLNFPRKCDFSELCFKFGKVYRYSAYKLNSKITWFTAS